METFLTRTMTIVALTCLLVAGAAVTAILGRDSAASPRIELASAASIEAPVANRASKQDRLAVVANALAAFEAIPTEPVQTDPALNESLRRAYASTSPAGRDMPPEILAPVAPPVAPAATQAAPAATQAAPPPPKPKAASKPHPQKNYALLSDVQIASIKERLKLSSSQEYYWPPVETALRAVARKIHAGQRANPHAAGVPIDPDAAEVQQLKSAAMPLLFQLREDQKSEVRSLARLIGLEKVAAMI